MKRALTREEIKEIEEDIMPLYCKVITKGIDYKYNGIMSYLCLFIFVFMLMNLSNLTITMTFLYNIHVNEYYA